MPIPSWKSALKTALKKSFLGPFLLSMRRTHSNAGAEIPQENHCPLTIVLTHWKRPKNVRRIIDQLAGQTVKPKIFLWNNNPPFRHRHISWQADSSINQFCWPRWWMASCAMTEFTAVMDDDVLFTDRRVLEDAVNFLRSCPEETAAGIAGAVLQPGKSYYDSRHVAAHRDGDMKVDLIKGRFLIVRTAQLAKVGFEPRPAHHIRMAEDILVCGKIAGGRPGKHIVPSLFAGRWKDLPGWDQGLSSASGHWENREKARQMAFSGVS